MCFSKFIEEIDKNDEKALTDQVEYAIYDYKKQNLDFYKVVRYVLLDLVCNLSRYTKSGGNFKYGL